MDQRIIRPQPNPLLAPLMGSGRYFYIFIAGLLILIGWFLYAWSTQLTQGLGVTAMRTPVGAAWGVYIASFIFFVCLAHGGIALAAAIRLMNLKKYAPIARIGEVLTIVSVAMAGMNIMIDMGRPDRIFNIVLYWPERVGSSSLSWDVTVVILYFTLSTIYLWLTMRKDLAKLLSRFPRLSLIYKVLLVGYRPDEESKIDKMSWWLSIAIVFLIVMLSGGVVPWIFGLLPARPGWFSALAGPYFLTAAIASSIAAVIVVAGILRRAYKWERQIPPEIFKGLGIFLGILTLFYVYLTLAEQLTMRYAAPLSELLISEKVITGEFAPIFWPTLAAFFFPSMLLIIQSVRSDIFNVTRTVFASIIIIVAFWVKRFIIVVPSLLRPLMPFPEGTYIPSWIEWSIIAGTFATAILIYAIFLKLFPIMELEEE